MCTGIELATLALTAAGGIAQHVDAANAASAASTNAAKTLEQGQEATNRANQKTPSIPGLAAANKGGGGIGSTSLTGPGGVDPSALSLGKSTLLGA